MEWSGEVRQSLQFLPAQECQRSASPKLNRNASFLFLCLSFSLHFIDLMNLEID